MKENKIAKRYASGLVKSIADETEYRDIKRELEEFVKILNSVEEFKAGMETSLLSQKQKIEILDALHQRVKFKEKTHQFLLTVMEENRLMFIDDIIEMLESMWFEKNGVEKLKVFSVIPLNSTLESKLKNNLETAFKKKVVLEKEIDPTLIAGIKIQRGLVFYDFSIEGNLKKLKEVLMAEHTKAGVSAEGER